jgi:hypothetical protein
MEGEKIVPKPTRKNWQRTMKFATEAALDQGNMTSGEWMNVPILMMNKAIGSMTIRRLLSHTM